ncbi:MAG: hypothetical protein K6F86_11705 [Lachnospiraceae bacterium]|nr:hypothetical protein [Lachnospiraceae bacterium]
MKRITVFAIILMISLFTGGCVFGDSVALDDENSKKVADYSTDIISKHNQYSNSRLVDVETVRKEYQKKIDLDAKKKNFIAMQRGANGEVPAEDTSSSQEGGPEGENTEEALPEPEISIAEALDIPEFDVKYTGFDVAVSYPDISMSDNLIMGMTAAQGDKLVIVHFLVTNNSGQDMECDVLSVKPQFRIRVNGERKTLQQTILENDLSKYSSVIPAGDSADTVLICEMSEADTENIETLSLIVRSAPGRPEYVLEE